MPRSHKWSIPFRLSDQNFVCISIFWNDRLTHWHHFTHIVRKLELIMRYKVGVARKRQTLKLIGKCMRQRRTFNKLFWFFEARNLCYWWPIRRLASDARNLATPLVGSINFLLITVYLTCYISPLKQLYFNNSDSFQKYAEIFYHQDPQTLPRHASLVTGKLFACIESPSRRRLTCPTLRRLQYTVRVSVRSLPPAPLRMPSWTYVLDLACKKLHYQSLFPVRKRFTLNPTNLLHSYKSLQSLTTLTSAKE
jgi:hypothetical protein